MREKIKELRELEDRRDLLASSLNNLKQKLNNSEINIREYNSIIALKNNSYLEEQTLKALNQKISTIKDKLRHHKQNNKPAVIIAFVIIGLIIVLAISQQANLTGLFTYQEKQTLVLPIEKTFNETSTIQFNISKLDSLQLDGSLNYYDNFSFEVILITDKGNFTIANEKSIKSLLKKVGPKSKSNLVTGLITNEENITLNQSNATVEPTEEIIEIINDSQDNVSNEIDINESIIKINTSINASVNVNDATINISDNLTNISTNITINLSENITENLSGNITTNISANISQNITELNLSDNLTDIENISIETPDNVTIQNQTQINITTNITTESNQLTLENICKDTCSLKDVNASAIIVKVKNAELFIDKFTYTTAKENNPPVQIKNFDNVTILINESLSYDLNEYFNDEDNDELLYDFKEVQSFSVSLNQSIVNISFNKTGEFNYYFYVSDTESLVQSNVFKINVVGFVNLTNQTNVTIDVVVSQVVINEPVLWKKIVGIGDGMENLSVNISDYGYNIGVLKVNESLNVSLDNLDVIVNNTKKSLEQYEVDSKKKRLDIQIIKKISESRKKSRDISTLNELKQLLNEKISYLDDADKKIKSLNKEISKIEKRIEKLLLGEEVEEDVINEAEEAEIVEEVAIPDEVELVIKELAPLIEVTYITDGPEVEEENVSATVKRVTISSDVHYTNILSYSDIMDSPKQSIKLYLIVNKTRQLVENVSYVDKNNNSLIDRIYWIIPHLSNQTYEIEITVLNPVEYLHDNETWYVYFNTTGTGNLTIWSNNSYWEELQTDLNTTDDEMKFLELTCNNISLKDSLIIIDENNNSYNYSAIQENNSIKPAKFLMQDYNCDNATSSFENYMNIAGYAFLIFEFRNQNMTVRDYALDPSSCKEYCVVECSLGWFCGDKLTQEPCCADPCEAELPFECEESKLMCYCGTFSGCDYGDDCSGGQICIEESCEDNCSDSHNGERCSDDGVNTWQTDGVCAKNSETGWDCDELEVTSVYSTYYRQDCYYANYTGTSVTSCDTNITAGFSAEGKCAVGADSSPDSVDDVSCDLGETCYAGSSYLRTECDYCVNGSECDSNGGTTYSRNGRCGNGTCCIGGDECYVEDGTCDCDYEDRRDSSDTNGISCDSDPSEGFTYDGVCAYDGVAATDDHVDCTTGMVAEHSSGEISQYTDYCYKGWSCDRDVGSSGYEKDSYCANSECCSDYIVSGETSNPTWADGNENCSCTGKDNQICDNSPEGGAMGGGVCSGGSCVDTAEVDSNQDGSFNIATGCNSTYNGALCDVDNDDTADGVCVGTSCDQSAPVSLDCGPNVCNYLDMGVTAWADCNDESEGNGCDNSFGSFTNYFFTQDGICTYDDGCDTSGHICYDGLHYQSGCLACGYEVRNASSCDTTLTNGDYFPNGICTDFTFGVGCDISEACSGDQNSGIIYDDCHNAACENGNGCEDGALGDEYNREGRCGGDDCCISEYIEGGTCTCTKSNATSGTRCDADPSEGSTYDGICILTGGGAETCECNTTEVCYTGSIYMDDCEYCNYGRVCEQTVGGDGFDSAGVCGASSHLSCCTDFGTDADNVDAPSACGAEATVCGSTNGLYCDDVDDGSWDAGTTPGTNEFRCDASDNTCISCDSNNKEQVTAPNPELNGDGLCELGCGADASADEKSPDACDSTSAYINSTCSYWNVTDDLNYACGCIMTGTKTYSVYWGIGGETNASVCCENTTGEYVVYEDYNANLDSAPAEDDDACCSDNTDCNDDNTCRADAYASTDVDADGDNDYCNSGQWVDCNTDAECSISYYCDGSNDCSSADITVTYQGQTPADSVRQIANSVTINVTVSSTGSNVDACLLEWEGSNESMTKVGSGTDVSCYKVKSSLVDGTEYTFNVHANNTVGGWGNESERSFTENTKPPTPTHLAPLDQARLYGNSQIINWTAGGTDDESDTITYYWRIGTLDPPTDKVCSGSTTNLYSSACSTTDGETYYWDIIAGDSYENQTITSTWEFTENNESSISNVVLTSTSGDNLTTDNLTVAFTSSDTEGDALTNITDWRKEGTSIAVLNMPFDTNISSTASDAVKDYSTFGNNGTLGGGTPANAPTWTSDGQVGGAYSFDGNDYIDLSDPYTLDGATSFTVEAWVSTNNVDDRQFILDLQNLHWDLQNKNMRCTLYNETNYSRINFGGDQFAATSTYYHVALVFDGSEVMPYFNGQLTGYTDNSTSGWILKSTSHSYIGKYETGIGWNGTIDEVHIYNYSLSPEQINASYQAGLAGHHTKTIVAEETSKGETWSVAVTPNDGYEDGTTVTSNTLFIESGTPEGNKFEIKDPGGVTVASIDSVGDFYLKGTLAQNQGSLTPTPNSFIVQDNTGTNIAYINSSGYAFITGSLYQNTAMSVSGSNLEIRDNTNSLVAFFDSSGNIKLSGQIAESYGNP